MAFNCHGAAAASAAFRSLQQKYLYSCGGYKKYTEESDKCRSRLWFFEGNRKIMLYTERAHFYFRYKIRGVKKLIIYSRPERKEFYPEIVNKLGEVDNGSCLVLFSRFDSYKLERIVGTPASKKMVSSMKNTFVFS